MVPVRSSRLWVCWDLPPVKPDPTDTILSFLRPSREDDLKNRHACEVLPAREASLSVRQKAREIYLRIVGRIGATEISDGITLRAALAKPGRTSAWWYHPVSFKDCETDPTFDRLIAIQT